MTNLFGNKDALIGSKELIAGAIIVLGSLIFRKSVANELLDKPFSIIGSVGCSIIGFLITSNMFDKLKFPVLITIGLFVAGGFLVGDLFGEGFADGGSS